MPHDNRGKSERRCYLVPERSLDEPMNKERISVKIIRSITALAAASVLILCITGWGSKGHSFVNQNGAQLLPSDEAIFRSYITYLSQHASDADARKSADASESPKHYIDIDEYQEFFDGTFPHAFADAQQMYGMPRLVASGYLPWVIEFTVDSVRNALRRGEFPIALKHAADLGHYVGDLAQPFHLTKNYDGQLTQNDGIHSRFETDLINRNIGAIPSPQRSIAPARAILDSIFRKIDRGWNYAPAILAADKAAIAITGKNNYNDVYYQLLWSSTRHIVVSQLHDAAQFFAELLYAAWIDAGKPKLTHVTESMRASRSDRIDFTLAPNPAVNETTVRIDRMDATAYLSIVDAQGRTVYSITTDEPMREGTVQRIRLSCFPAGLYFVVAQNVSSSIARPLVVLR